MVTTLVNPGKDSQGASRFPIVREIFAELHLLEQENGPAKNVVALHSGGIVRCGLGRKAKKLVYIFPFLRRHSPIRY